MVYKSVVLFVFKGPNMLKIAPAIVHQIVWRV